MYHLAIMVLATSLAAAAVPGVISVGPNILVSQDIDAPHVEPMIAVSPADGKRMVGAATTFARTTEGLYNKVYTSQDGGYSWTATALDADARYGSGDPQVDFGITGTTYFVSLIVKNGGATEFARSPDGGTTWRKPLQLWSCDHEQIAVDRSNGPHRGRTYIDGEGERPHTHTAFGDRVLGLLRSDDDGQSFTPVKFIAGDHLGKGVRFDTGGVGAVGLLVLGDGTLVAGIVRYQNSLIDKKTDVQRLSVVTSPDGGASFGPETKIADYYVATPSVRAARELEVLRGDLTKSFSFPTLAADDSNGPYRNRIYAVWSDYRGGPSRLSIAHSVDRGRTWSRPIDVDADAHGADGDFLPAMAVSDRGVVGIAFLRTTAAGDRSRYDVYFAASFDGGESLQAPVRISSRTSIARGAGNLRPMAVFKSNARDGVRSSFISGFSRWPDGGDYMGMTSESGNTFRVLWPDSRSGTFQLYTAKVAVDDRSDAAPPVGSASVSLDGDVQLVFDPSQYDARSGDFIFPIRLKNVSSQNIAGPVSVRLKSTGSPDDKRYGRTGTSFTVINAANGRHGAGATFDYSAALGTSRILAPGAVSDAIDWRIHLGNPANLDDLLLSVDVTGHLARGK